MLCFVMFPSNGAEWKESGTSGSPAKTAQAMAISGRDAPWKKGSHHSGQLEWRLPFFCHNINYWTQPLLLVKRAVEHIVTLPINLSLEA